MTQSTVSLIMGFILGMVTSDLVAKRDKPAELKPLHIVYSL